MVTNHPSTLRNEYSRGLLLVTPMYLEKPGCALSQCRLPSSAKVLMLPLLILSPLWSSPIRNSAYIYISLSSRAHSVSLSLCRDFFVERLPAPWGGPRAPAFFFLLFLFSLYYSRAPRHHCTILLLSLLVHTRHDTVSARARSLSLANR